MRAFVFTDPALASQAGQFVWLDLNTDNTGNEPVLQKHEADALPTFLVVDPKDESVVLRWVGSFSVAQADAFLEEAREKLRSAATPASPADAALDRADRLYGKRDYAAAAAAYREALAQAEAGWPRRNRAVEALLYAYQSTQAFKDAVALAREALARVAGTPSALIVGTSGLDSASELPQDAPGRAAAIAELEAALQSAIADPKLVAAADDRSGAYLSLLGARKAKGDGAGARRIAGEWAAFLEGEAAKAKGPDERAVFDSHRLSAYLALGEPQRAIPMLEQSQRELPGDYNPPSRLARAYASLKEWDKALAASDQALALASGRAKLRVLTARAQLFKEKGDTDGARRTYDEAIAFAESLPEAERPAKQIEQLKTQRDKLAAPAAVSGQP
jgi:tetratricopeptide (TPR) repeat protein